MRRLERVLRRNLVTGSLWKKESGYIYRFNNARAYFLSGAPTASVVGATATALLECDEAQDVQIDKWDREFSPMAASANATRVFWGTAWTSATLLHREKQAALAAEAQDGQQRLFQITADNVAGEVPAYREYVEGEIRKLGRNHPFVRTQYFSEEIEAAGGMFPPERRQLMQGAHLPLDGPQPEGLYAFLLDVGGEAAAAAGGLHAPGSSIASGRLPGQLALFETGPAPASASRDSTALTIVQIDLASLPVLHVPTYRVVSRRVWQGAPHSRIFAEITALAESWAPPTVVCDATGVGAGLASFLAHALGEGQVARFLFSAASKSKLGWDFLAVVETGRFKDHAPPGAATPLQAIFWRQVEACEAEIQTGPGQELRWGVPDGRRDPASGALIHDDLLISAALCAVLDGQSWGLAHSHIISGVDPVAGMNEVY